MCTGDAADHLGGAAHAGRRHAADDARHHALGVVRAARIDALGREGHEHVGADREATLGERIDDEVARAANVARGREDDDLADPRVRNDRLAGRLEGVEVRCQRLVDGRRDAHHHRVGRGDGRGVVGQVEAVAAKGGRQADVVLGQDVDRQLPDRGDPAAADLEADDGAADLFEAERDRQADVAQADDRDGRKIERTDDGREHRRVDLVDVHDAHVVLAKRIATQHRGVGRIYVKGHWSGALWASDGGDNAAHTHPRRGRGRDVDKCLSVADAAVARSGGSG